MLYTVLYMDNGLEYKIEQHPEDVMRKLLNDVGVVINSFVQIDKVVINPSHVSSIGTYQNEEN